MKCWIIMKTVLSFKEETWYILSQALYTRNEPSTGTATVDITILRKGLQTFDTGVTSGSVGELLLHF